MTGPTRATRLAALIVAVAAAPLTNAQTLPFSLRVQQGTNLYAISDGGTIALTADAIGRQSDAIVTITHLGVAPVSPTGVVGTPVGTALITAVDLTGATDFFLNGIPDPTQTFPVGQGFALGVHYKPGTSLKVAGAVKVFYTETPPATSSNPNPKSTLGSFSLNLTGVAPEFAFSVIPLPAGNAAPLNPGDNIVFAVANVNDSSSVAIVITNRGSGGGYVNGIALNGPATLSLLGLPQPPAFVDTGKALQFSVKYSPLQVENASGSVRIDFIDRSVTFGLQASSQGPVYAYDLLQGSTVSALLPGQTIAVPDVNVGDKSTVVMRVRNTGNADGKITSIDVLGAGFQLTDLPFVPLTLSAGNAATFTVNFTPAQPGPFSARLRVGADTFAVTGNGLGQTLVYSYIAGGVSSTVQNNGNVIFSPVPVGQTSTVHFQINNTGTAAGSVSSISVSTTGTIFGLANVPDLPVAVNPGDTVSFDVTFAPNVVGSATGSLKIDNLTLNLSGAGNQPAAIPAYRFSGASGTQEPAQQVGIGLALAAAYPLNLNGTLTLTFNSDVFANDPAVQFATGGRTVNFLIPAGATQAVFPNNATQIRLQTGTVAGTINLSPSFISDGGINLTPATPPSLNLTVAQGAPRLVNLQVVGKTASGFNLLVTGYATGRSITEIDITFTPTSGESVSTTKLALNVESTFNAWYQGATSPQFGSQFTATIPLVLSGDVKNVTNVSDTVQAVAVTLANRQGASATTSVNVP